MPSRFTIVAHMWLFRPLASADVAAVSAALSSAWLGSPWQAAAALPAAPPWAAPAVTADNRIPPSAIDIGRSIVPPVRDVCGMQRLTEPMQVPLALEADGASRHSASSARSNAAAIAR